MELAAGRAVSPTRTDAGRCRPPQPERVYSLEDHEKPSRLTFGLVQYASTRRSCPGPSKADRVGVSRFPLPATRGRRVGLVLLFSTETGGGVSDSCPTARCSCCVLQPTSGLAMKHLARPGCPNPRLARVRSPGGDPAIGSYSHSRIAKGAVLQSGAERAPRGIRRENARTRRLARCCRRRQQRRCCERHRHVIMCATNSFAPIVRALAGCGRACISVLSVGM